jgi:hypothetical protein
VQSDSGGSVVNGWGGWARAAAFARHVETESAAANQRVKSLAKYLGPPSDGKVAAVAAVANRRLMDVFKHEILGRVFEFADIRAGFVARSWCRYIRWLLLAHPIVSLDLSELSNPFIKAAQLHDHFKRAYDLSALLTYVNVISYLFSSCPLTRCAGCV